jgi:hypothetical protein
MKHALDTFYLQISAVLRKMEFFNSVGPGRWSGQSGKELVLAAAFLHPEMERQAMEVAVVSVVGFRTPNNSVAPSFVRRAVINGRGQEFESPRAYHVLSIKFPHTFLLARIPALFKV